MAKKHLIQDCKGRCILQTMRDEIDTLIMIDEEEAAKKREPGRPEKVSPLERLPRLRQIQALILQELRLLNLDEKRLARKALKAERAFVAASRPPRMATIVQVRPKPTPQKRVKVYAELVSLPQLPPKSEPGPQHLN